MLTVDVTRAQCAANGVVCSDDGDVICIDISNHDYDTEKLWQPTMFESFPALRVLTIENVQGVGG